MGIPTNLHSRLDRPTLKGSLNSKRLSTLTHYNLQTISKCRALVPAARSTQTELAVASREIANVHARARANLSAHALLHALHALNRATKTLVNAQTRRLAAGPTARGAAAADKWPTIMLNCNISALQLCFYRNLIFGHFNSHGAVYWF